MSASSAITINRSEQEIASQLAQADPPLSGEDVQIAYAPAPGDRGTEVRVRLDQQAPGGAVGQKIAALAGTDPQRQLDDALRRFKQLVETGRCCVPTPCRTGTDAKQQRTQGPAEPTDTNEEG